MVSMDNTNIKIGIQWRYVLYNFESVLCCLAIFNAYNCLCLLESLLLFAIDDESDCTINESM